MLRSGADCGLSRGESDFGFRKSSYGGGISRIRSKCFCASKVQSRHLRLPAVRRSRSDASHARRASLSKYLPTGYSPLSPLSRSRIAISLRPRAHATATVRRPRGNAGCRPKVAHSGAGVTGRVVGAASATADFASSSSANEAPASGRLLALGAAAKAGWRSVAAEPTRDTERDDVSVIGAMLGGPAGVPGRA